MRTLITVFLVALSAGAQSPERGATPSSDTSPAVDEPAIRSGLTTGVPGVESRIHPLMNVEIIDKYGVKTALVAFHRVSGENKFVGYLGAADVEVPYEKIKSIRIAAAEEPGGRMRADLQLHTGKEVAASFDEREGEQLFAGYATFGRVTVFWRDIRQLEYVGRTKTTDLPKYGKATGGVDVKLKDRDGVETELVAFRRATGDNYLAGLRGAMRVEVPLRIVKRAVLKRPSNSPLLRCSVDLKGRRSIQLRVKRYETVSVYRGRAEFGNLRIRLGEIRELTVHRSTPAMRDLDPVAAAEGREVEIGKTPKR